MKYHLVDKIQAFAVSHTKNTAFVVSNTHNPNTMCYNLLTNLKILSRILLKEI